jgi:hypothetical protein
VWHHRRAASRLPTRSAIRPVVDRPRCSLEAERALALPREVQNLSAAADALSKLDRELKGPAGLWTLLRDKAVTRDLATQLAALQSATLAFEQSLDQTGVTDTVDPAVELRNQALVRSRTRCGRCCATACRTPKPCGARQRRTAGSRGRGGLLEPADRPVRARSPRSARPRLGRVSR